MIALVESPLWRQWQSPLNKRAIESNAGGGDLLCGLSNGSPSRLTSLANGPPTGADEKGYNKERAQFR